MAGTPGMSNGFNPLAAGRKMYGAGRPFPTMGRVDPLGYKNRSANKAAILRRLRAKNTGNYMQPDLLRSLK